MKKIAVVVPVATDAWNSGVQTDLDGCKDADTEVRVVRTAFGPESIECNYDVACAELFAVREAERAAGDGCDGVVLYCFGDPGLRAAKERLSIPVVGLGEAAMHLASLVGSRFGIVAVGPSAAVSVSHIDVNVKAYGMADKCAAIRCVEMPVLGLAMDRSRLSERVFAVARRVVEDDGADVIVLGCGSALGIDEVLADRLGVPVIVPGRAALKLCEDLVALGVRQSPRFYGTPPEKRRVFPGEA